MLDLHTHVWAHRPGTPVPTYDLLESYCEAAVDRGIAQLAITEHSHRFTRIIDEVLPHWKRPRTGEIAAATDHVLDVEGGANLDAYVSSLVDAQDRGLPLLIGLEVDHLPGASEAMSSVLAEYPFDVLLGSVHWLDDWLFDAYDIETFGSEWATRDTDLVFAQYVDAVIELAQSGTVDVLAHVDVIKVAGHLPRRLGDHERRLVSALADTNVVIELSSAGLRKPVNDIYPSPSLLDQLVAAGMAFTTASDAHAVEQIGSGFARLRTELAARQITELTTFSRRASITVAA